MLIKEKFFIHLGFAFILNLSLVEKLWNFNGRAIDDKSRQFVVFKAMPPITKTKKTTKHNAHDKRICVNQMTQK